MPERDSENKRRSRGHHDLLQRRAERRARRRLEATQTDSNQDRIGILRRAGLALRETAWTAQEKLLWPLSDWARLGSDAVRWPIERATWAIRERLLWPLQDRLTKSAGSSTKVPRVATLGALGAIAIGALGAGALVASDSGDTAPAEPQSVLVAQAEERANDEAEQLTPIVARTEPKADQPALKGVRPSFGSRSDEERAEARSVLRKLKSEQKEPAGDKADATEAAAASESGENVDGATADSGSADSGAAGDDGSAKTSGDSDTTESSAAVSNVNPKKVRRQESPLNVAERFAMAFVSYEVGASGQPIETAFKDTTDSDLFDSLMDRPPRQPTGGKVPKARVVNVVGGPRKKNAMEVSIGLLRVDGISEIRLDMKRLGRGWVVKTVRG